MNVNKLNKKLIKLYKGAVTARDDGESMILSGELDDWENIIIACQMAVQRDKRKHVVNDIKLKNVQMPSMRMPELNDEALEGARPDILIIGGGITGASVARELTKWKISVLLVDKEPDVAMHASGRNDGEVHPGIDLSKGTLKQHYVLLGNAVYEKTCKELGVAFKPLGQYVGLLQWYLAPAMLAYALKRRFIDGVKDARVVSGRKLRKIAPTLNPKFVCALYNKSASSVCPYGLTIAYAENAVTNGARVSLNTAVSNMDIENGCITCVYTNRGRIYPRLVINAAGAFADVVAQMAGDRFFSIHPRRGTNSILDKKTSEKLGVIATIKEINLKEKHTKGGGILHTAHDNLLVGPDAVETYERENTATRPESIKNVFAKQIKTMPSLSKNDVITYFTGVRAPTFEEDFILERGRRTKNIYHCAGIQSPGLTAAPAFAADVAEQAVALLGGAQRNEAFDPVRKPIPTLRELNLEERAKLIAKNPDYGVIVCRCEEVSKGEIIDALNSPISVPTLDGVKKRVRPGMGRCQGGFCSPLVMQIIAEHENIPLEKVKKSSQGAYIAVGKLGKSGVSNEE